MPLKLQKVNLASTFNPMVVATHGDLKSAALHSAICRLYRTLLKGGLLADVVVVIGSIDPVMGEADK